MTLERAYYHCESCRTGFCPRDRTLGIDETTLSPAATRMTAAAAARVSFQEASTLLDELAGLAVDPKQVERTAEALGRAIAADERQAVEPETHRAQPTLYLGVDGTGIPVRKAETAQRQGKQPDGSAKTREVKLAVAWTAERRHPQTGIPMRDPDSISYTAAIETAASRDTDREPSPFAQRVCAKPNAAVSPMPTAGSSSATARPGSGPSPTSVSPMRSRSSTSSTPKATSGTSPRPSTHPGPTSPRSGRNNDMTNSTGRPHQRHRRRPRSPRPNLRRGPQMHRLSSSATVNACAIPRSAPGACASPPASSRLAANDAIRARLKRAGMHWSVNGANAIIALRCCILSGALRSLLGTTKQPPHNPALTNLTCTPAAGGTSRSATGARRGDDGVERAARPKPDRRPE